VKLIHKSAVALMLGVLILASAASASYVASVGGASSGSTSGGATSGTTTLGVRTLTGISYEDTGAATNLLNGPNWGLGTIGSTLYTHILTETIGATASVANGDTGTATASFTTDGAQTVNQALPTATFPTGGYLSTSVDGSAEVSVSKTSTGGAATATAVIEAQSAATTAGIGGGLGGTAQLYATATQSGVGEVLSEAKGDASHSSNVGSDILFSKGSANGDAKVSGTNSALGGSITGTANIYAGTNIVQSATNTLIGQSIVQETVDLNANRGISLEGDSKIEALLDGEEMAETSYVSSIALPNTLPTIVDAEATSVMNGLARALHKHDSADVDLTVRAETGTDGAAAPVALADSQITGTAIVRRDSAGTSTEKAQGEGFITHADWTASTQVGYVPTVATNDYASVQGQTHSIDLTDSEGLGVGSWLATAYINPMISSGLQTQSAVSGVWTPPAAGVVSLTGVPSYPVAGGAILNPAAIPAVRGNTETYNTRLSGMVAGTQTNDAVGVYLGVDSQILTNDVTQAVPAAAAPQRLTRNERNGIEWLEGANTNPLPGHYTTNVVPTWITVVTPIRTSGLTGI